MGTLVDRSAAAFCTDGVGMRLFDRAAAKRCREPVFGKKKDRISGFTCFLECGTAAFLPLYRADRVSFGPGRDPFFGTDDPGAHNGWHYGKIYVEPNQYVRENVVANVWGTICLPYDATVNPSEVKAYDVTAIDFEGRTVTVTEHEGKLEAGKTYIIKPLADGDITVNMTGGNVSASENNGLYGNVDAETVVLDANDPTYNFYIIHNNQFHRITGDAKANIAQFRGYMRVLKSGGGSPALRIIESENNATNIHDVDGSDQIVKFIENGQLYIFRDGITYDVMGRIIK